MAGTRPEGLEAFDMKFERMVLPLGIDRCFINFNNESCWLVYTRGSIMHDINKFTFAFTVYPRVYNYDS